MLKSEAISDLFTALSLAQGEFKPLKKSKINPHFKKAYSDLSDINEATGEALVKHGFCVIQEADVIDGRVVISTMLAHKSGQWIATKLSLRPEGDTPQKIGSAITYGRRYAIQAILNISGEEDDDGNAAEGLDDKKATSKSLSRKVQFQQANPNVPPPPPPPPPPTFDIDNGEHVVKLIKGLDAKQVPIQFHDGVALKMAGRPFTKKEVTLAIEKEMGNF